MALIETNTIRVANDQNVINETNAVYGSFGWVVSNVQITHSQDSVAYQTNPELITVETKTINYATITYQRDKHMANYEKITQLEAEFWSAVKRINDIREVFDTNPNIGFLPLGLGIKWDVIILVVGFFAMIIAGLIGKGEKLLGGPPPALTALILLCAVLAAGIIYAKTVKKKPFLDSFLHIAGKLLFGLLEIAVVYVTAICIAILQYMSVLDPWEAAGVFAVLLMCAAAAAYISYSKSKA